MSKNELHKSFSLKPLLIINYKSGEIIETQSILESLKKDIEQATIIAEWCIQTDNCLLTDLNKVTNLSSKQPTAIAREIGLKIPKNIRGNSGAGVSRLEELIQDRIISEALSWNERLKAFNGASGKYMSSGWKRTVNPMRPTELTPKLNLAAANKSYSEIVNDPLVDGYIDLKMVINKNWYILRFENFKRKRFKNCLRLTKPTVRITKNNDVIFDFTAVYPYTYADISSDYIVSVDVGVTNYVTLGVYQVSTKRLIYSTTLSDRVHSLANSVKASESQKKSLYKLGRLEESALHRRAATRKKRELAIIAAGEIAQIAKKHDNSVVVFEDLSWVKNTMQNGRWNRGELVKWSKHFVELNGSRAFKVNSAMTSQWCYRCDGGIKIVFRDYHTVVCPSCGVVEDRDVNATGNISKRFVDSLSKVIVSRRKSRSFVNFSPQVTPVTRNNLKYPGRDRSKTESTLKRPKNNNNSNNGGRCLPVNNYGSAIGMNNRTIIADEFESKSNAGTPGAASVNNMISDVNITYHNN